VAAILNAYPYGTGHLLVMPVRHNGRLDNLPAEVSTALWQAINDASRAVEKAYRPDGMNIGFNLGKSAGAGIPEHLHAHVLPRWSADTNFITSVANTKVLPEALDITWKKLNDAWPS
jgi:diadenosine tetraphosphate (Ap4A) HIT family hydrolase